MAGREVSRWWAGALLLAATVIGCSSCGVLGHEPVVVDDTEVITLPAGYEVIHRDDVGCAGTGETGWSWRDLVVTGSEPADEAVEELVSRLQGQGFGFEPANTPSKAAWFLRSASNGDVEVEIGTGADYGELGSIVDTSSTVAQHATSPDAVVIRLRPENVECVI